MKRNVRVQDVEPHHTEDCIPAAVHTDATPADSQQRAVGDSGGGPSPSALSRMTGGGGQLERHMAGGASNVRKRGREQKCTKRANFTPKTRSINYHSQRQGTICSAYFSPQGALRQVDVDGKVLEDTWDGPGAPLSSYDIGNILPF
ncbi:Hypothetical protein SMAX5B_005109 [Scophthalmus maximus]|uniref:Uncharacterized protein n=1 Tax=Scophthalmus maximus TaxID=52904 RepID=A0A2U9BV95_SCOMX|nr:Hypothetical protein SMAX5B_005109 [Scophthalmus maximus]